MPTDPNQLPGDPNDPQGMLALMELHLEWMQIKNYSPETVKFRRIYLGYFIRWCAERGITRPNEITKPIIERHQRYLFLYRKHNGDPLSFRSQNQRLTALRSWFKWLARQNHLLYNPASEIELPKLGKRLPKHVLSQSEAEQIINLAKVTEPVGLRDRAILETLYSTGIRRRECTSLRLYDLDAERGTLMIRQGKGNKDRLIPIGDRAMHWIDRYLREVRPALLIGNSAGDVLFLTPMGEPITPQRLTETIQAYVTAADIGKKGSCHLFRHTMATLMLENGADIRYIQAMLGHSQLETTQIYTQVSIKKLKEIHTATHPARMKRNP